MRETEYFRKVTILAFLRKQKSWSGELSEGHEHAHKGVHCSWANRERRNEHLADPSQRFCRFGIGRRTKARQLGSHQLLHVDRHFGQRFDSRAVFAQSVLHHAEIEARDYDVIPSVSDSAQRYVQHSDNLIA